MTEATKASYLTDTNISNLQSGQRLIYNGTNWINTVQQDISNLIELSDLSATNVAASGKGDLSYDSSTGKFTYTPAEKVYAGAEISQTIDVTSDADLNEWTSQVANGITVGSTNVFTTPTTGWYSLGYSFEFLATTNSDPFKSCVLRIKRNGTDFLKLKHGDAGTAGHVDLSRPFGGSILINMTAPTDFITFTAQADNNEYRVTGMVSLVKVD